MTGQYPAQGTMCERNTRAVPSRDVAISIWLADCDAQSAARRLLSRWEVALVDEMVWLIRLCRIIAKNYESDRGASREELAMAYVYREVERDMEEILGMSVVDAP